MDRREALKLSAAFMGYSLSGLVFSGMLQGCEIESSKSWAPLFFTKEQAHTIGEIAEQILPKTATVGAKDVFVDRFIDMTIANCYTDEAKEKFVKGLEIFQKECEKLTGKYFEKCSKKERDLVLSKKETIPYDPSRYVWGRKVYDGDETPFYRELKGLCLFGYFSSEEVGENVLNYDPVPGKFVGCVPLSEIGNAWSL